MLYVSWKGFSFQDICFVGVCCIFLAALSVSSQSSRKLPKEEKDETEIDASFRLIRALIYWGVSEANQSEWEIRILEEEQLIWTGSRSVISQH